MGQQILNPVTTVPGYPIGPYSLVGAATVHAALADASDASYVQTDDSAATHIGISFPAPTVPAEGYLVRSVQLRIRRSVNAAALAQHSPFWWWRMEANDNGFLGSGVNIQHHERVMGPELTGNLDGTTAIQDTTTSVISWFDDGEHVRNMRFGDARFILLNYPMFIGGAQIRIYKAELIVNYTSLPIATVTAPPDPVNSSKPTVTWSYSDADNDVQTRARVVIVKPGTPSDTWPYGLPGQAGYQADGARTKAWDSGDRYTAGTSLDTEVGLTNGQQYYAYVRVWAPPAASTEQRSLWYYKVFTVTATAAAAPTFTVTTDPANARILLNVQESTTATPHPAYYEIERLDPGASEYVPVRGGEQVGSYVGARSTGTGVGWSMPDRSDLAIGGGFLVIRWRGIMTDYTPAAAATLVSKGRTSGNQREWLLRMRTDGRLEFQWSTAGTSYDRTNTASVATAVTDNTETWFQATVVPSSGQVTFYKGTDGVNWTQLGTIITTTTGSMFNSTAPVDLGGLDGFTSEPLLGVVKEARLFNNQLTQVAAPKIEGQEQLTSSFIDEAGNTWTYTAGANGYNQVQLVVYDYEAPMGVPVTYEARSWRQDTDTVPSAWVTAAGGPWTLAALRWWLKDPLMASSNMGVSVVALKYAEQKQMTSSIPIGTAAGVVTHTGVRGTILSGSFRLLDKATRAQFQALMRSGRTLLFQSVLGDQWYVQPAQTHPYEILKASPVAGETSPIRDAHVIDVDLVEVEAP